MRARSPVALRLARAYCRWRCGRDLDGVWVAGADRLRGSTGPLILAPNHVAWWDVLVLVLLDEALGADLRCLMDARNLARLPFLAKLGAIPLRRGDAAREDLAGAAAWLREAPATNARRRILVIFPQGRQRPAHLRPLGFRRGVELLAEASGAPVVPVGWNYGFREDHRPAAAVALGTPCPPRTDALEAATDALLHDIDILLTGDGEHVAGAFHALVQPPGRRTDDGIGSRVLAWLTRSRTPSRPALGGATPTLPTRTHP